MTGLEKFPAYLTLLFEIDSLVLHIDRNLDNICVLEENGRYDYFPICDLRSSLMANIYAYPMDVHPIRMIDCPTTYPFHITISRQVRTAQSLYGKQLRIPKFTYDELMEELQPLLEYYTSRRRDQIASRVCHTVCSRQNTIL